MKISLVFPPIEAFESKIPPIGIAYLASVLLKENVDVSVYDMNASEESINETVKKILKENPVALGISSSTPTITKSLEIAEKIKKANERIIIIMGGPHPSVMHGELLESPFVDICVRGEGEIPIRDIVKYLRKERDLKGIKGISYKKKGKIIINPDSRPIENLDEIPFPAWHLFDLSKYRNFVADEKFSLPIVTSRGCPFNCSFCFKGIFGKRWRFRSPENVVEEVNYLIKNFGIKEFSVADDNFTLDPKRAIRFCELLIEKGIKIRWRCTNGIRADITSNELMRAMKKAGCYFVAFGVETGDDKIMKMIDKGESIEQIRRAFKIAKKNGLETLGFFMFGNLGENIETMKKTIQLAKELDPDFAQFSIATPFPGSRMYEEIKKNGEFLIKSWNDYVFYEGKPIFSYHELNPKLINSMYRRAYREFYFRPRYFLKWMVKLARSPGKIPSVFRGFRQYLNTQSSKEKQQQTGK